MNIKEVKEVLKVKGSVSEEITNKDLKVAPIMVTFLLSGFMGMFSETALNMSMNDLIIEFSISPSSAQWLTTGYLLVLGILIPVSGLLIKRYPTRNLFITSLSFSITGVFIAAISPSYLVLLSGRIIQAVGTGILVPLLFHTVLILFPPEKRGTAMGLVGLVMMSAPAIGPVSAGLIIDYFDWHMIFWIVLPFFVFALVFGLLYLPNISKVQKQKIDILSIILSTLGFGGIVFGFSFAGENGWSSPLVIVAFIIGITSLTVYIFRQLSIEDPVLHLEVFKYPMFALGIVITLFANLIVFSSYILLPLFLQGGMGLSASRAGLLLLPGGISNGVMAVIGGKIFDKRGPRRLIIIGFIINTIALIYFSKIDVTSNQLWIIIFYIVLMVGIAMVTTPSQTNGINALQLDRYPDGTAIVNSAIQTSGAIGTAIAISILNMTQNKYLSSINGTITDGQTAEALILGTQNAFLFAIIMSLLGFVCSLFIKRIIVDK